MSHTRREFLITGSGVAVGALLPDVFRETAEAAPKSDRPGGRETVLVVIQLTGGNDGLNTVIPFNDPVYRSERPKLRQPAASVHKINGELALHPVMSGFSKLLEDSKLAIVQGVGYPNPNRSHFESMDIWHRASKSKAERYGWIGRALPKLGGPAAALHIGGGDGPLALFSATGHAPSLNSLKDYQLRLGAGPSAESKRKLIERLAEPSFPSSSLGTRAKSSNGLLDLVRSSARQTYKSSQQMRRVAKELQGKDAAGYPQTGLATRLKLMARLIDAGVPERVYYTSLEGFDTHAAQAKTQPNLLKELSDAVAAFEKDLKQHGHQKRVLVMTFSEFGRRVRENGSEGTDHGAASQMFLVGDAVKAGPIGRHPSLSDLVNGDLKFHTDFRSVYATILKNWLHVEPVPILGRKFPLLPLFGKTA
jgi:uncharacterized protein (DUF1501 family)